VLLPKSFDADLRAMDLAREDFVGMMSGFTRPGGDVHVHPLGIVACDDERDAMRAARHLVDDVKVPAVLGLGSGAEVVDVGTTLLVPESVLGVASISTSPLVTGIPNRPGQPRLMWRTTYSSAETAKAIAHVVPDLFEPQIRGLPGVLPREAPMRVAFLREKSRGGPIFDDMLFDALRFNGKSALANGANFREIVFDDSEPGSGEAAAESALDALRAFAPHVVVFGANPSAIVHVIEPFEESAPPAAYHPRYLWMTALHQEALDWIGTSAGRRRRFFGLEPVSTRAVNARFVLHYNEGAAQKVTRTVCPNSSYDAFYLAAYATYALGDQPVTGTNLARAVARLVPPGKAIDVGPAGIFDAFSTLRRGENIDVNGATGSLDFDLAKGEAPFDQALLCVGVDDAGRASGSVESGVVFDSAAGRLEGELRCP
jgi:branched-chain amino acid transport system substrate-binding protein